MVRHESSLHSHTLDFDTNVKKLFSQVGSHSECVLNLQSFGIPTTVLPFTESGEVTTRFHKEFLENRRKQERLSSQAPRIGVPGRFDVLLGRGKKYDLHMGNVRFRHLIEDCREKYESASRNVKTKLSAEIVEIVHENCGRFLKQDGVGWVEVEDETARLKVSHAFRAMRAKNATKEEQC